MPSSNDLQNTPHLPKSNSVLMEVCTEKKLQPSLTESSKVFAKSTSLETSEIFEKKELFLSNPLELNNETIKKPGFSSLESS